MLQAIGLYLVLMFCVYAFSTAAADGAIGIIGLIAAVVFGLWIGNRTYGKDKDGKDSKKY